MTMRKNKLGMKHHSKSGASKTILSKQKQTFRLLSAAGDSTVAKQLFPHLAYQKHKILKPTRPYPKLKEGIIGRYFREVTQAKNLHNIKMRATTNG